MREKEEIYLYIEQMIQAFLWHGRLTPALDECRMILPREGRLYTRVDAAYHMLMTGEGVTGTDAMREALGRIEGGDPYVAILHQVLIYSEESGQRCERALGLLAEETDLVYGGGCRDKRYRDRTGNRHRGNRKKRAERLAKAYAGLQSMKPGRKKKKQQERIVKELEGELDVCLVAMQVFTLAMGVSEALKFVQGVVHGFLRIQVRDLKNRLAAGEDMKVLCRDFLSELDLYEVSSCMLSCFGREGEGVVIRPVMNRQEDTRFRGVWKKGFCAVVIAAVVGVWGVMSMEGVAVRSGQGDQKESRLRHALTQALTATVGEMPGVKETNQLLAGFMQHMLQQVDDDIDLTVKICDMDTKEQTLEVEAVGEYESVPGNRRSIRVRRRLRF